MSFKFINFIFLTFLICNISTASIQVFKKDSKLETTSKLTAFESKEIASEIEMFFKISSEHKCGDILQYQYLSSIPNDIQYLTYTFKFEANKKLSEKTKIKNGKTSTTTYTKYFAIKKDSNLFETSNGDYLLLGYECNGRLYEIENVAEIPDNSNSLTIVFIVVGCVLGVGLIIAIVCCICRKVRIAKTAQHINDLRDVNYPPGAYYPQGQAYPYGQMYPQGNMYGNNRQVIVNGNNPGMINNGNISNPNAPMPNSSNYNYNNNVVNTQQSGDRVLPNAN